MDQRFHTYRMLWESSAGDGKLSLPFYTIRLMNSKRLRFHNSSGIELAGIFDLPRSAAPTRHGRHDSLFHLSQELQDQSYDRSRALCSWDRFVAHRSEWAWRERRTFRGHQLFDRGCGYRGRLQGGGFRRSSRARVVDRSLPWAAPCLWPRPATYLPVAPSRLSTPPSIRAISATISTRRWRGS